MMEQNPERRPEIADILLHPWSQARLPSTEELRDEMRKRVQVFIESHLTDVKRKHRDKVMKIHNKHNGYCVIPENLEPYDNQTIRGKPQKKEIQRINYQEIIAEINKRISKFVERRCDKELESESSSIEGYSDERFESSNMMTKREGDNKDTRLKFRQDDPKGSKTHVRFSSNCLSKEANWSDCLFGENSLNEIDKSMIPSVRKSKHVSDLDVNYFSDREKSGMEMPCIKRTLSN